MASDTLLATGLEALFYIITLVFVFYSLFLAYHWFTYGSSRTITTLSIAIYLLVSSPLFLTMALILNTLSL